MTYRPDITEEFVKAEAIAAAKAGATGESCPYTKWTTPWYDWHREFIKAGGKQK